MTKREKKKWGNIARKINAKRERAKKLYGEIDSLLDKLVAAVPVGEALPVNGDGRTVRVVDNFAGKSTVFKASGIRRFDIKFEEGDCA